MASLLEIPPNFSWSACNAKGMGWLPWVKHKKVWLLGEQAVLFQKKLKWKEKKKMKIFEKKYISKAKYYLPTWTWLDRRKINFII